MKVYRVEHPDTGRGPYCYQNEIFHDQYSNMFDEHMNPNTHPSTFMDGISYNLTYKHNYIMIGCSSKQKLKDWFKGYIPKLLEIGYKIYCYTVKPKAYVHGNSKKQIGFSNLGIISKEEIKL